MQNKHIADIVSHPNDPAQQPGPLSEYEPRRTGMRPRSGCMFNFTHNSKLWVFSYRGVAGRSFGLVRQ